MAAPRGRQRVVDTSDWRRSLRSKSMPLTIFFLLIFGGVSLAQPIQVWFHQRQSIADYQAQLQHAKDAVKRMQVERKRWEDPVYIRSQARDRLYYVMPGEVSYLVMDADGVDQSDVSGTFGAKLSERKNTSQFSQSILQTKNNWVDNVIESVLRSGIEEPVRASK